MAQRKSVLLIIPESARIRVIEGKSKSSSADTVRNSPEGILIEQTDLQRYLATLSIENAECVIGLHSDDCLFARIPGQQKSRHRTHDELVFLAEPYLPLSAEDMSATFHLTDGNLYVIACRRRLLADLVTSLQTAGISVAAICPLVYLGLTGQQGALKSSVVRANSPLSTVDHLRFDKTGSIVDWTCTSEESSLRLLSEEPFKSLHWSWEDAVQGARNLRGLRPADLLQDPSIQSSLGRSGDERLKSWCLVLTICLTIASFAFLWRTTEYRAIVAGLDDQVTDVLNSGLSELPETRRTSAQLRSKLTRLRKQQSAIVNLEIADHGDTVLAGLLDQIASLGAAEVRTVDVRRDYVSVAVRNADSATLESRLQGFEVLGIKFGKAESRMENADTVISMQLEPVDHEQ